MGVTGLWRLIDPAGKPVPIETLENKVLAVDISIWLHQMVKGYQDARGAPLPNAHLIGLFQRLCKLLYFRIKPVFVFDGAFPELKKETIAKRQDSKAKLNSESERLKREILLLLGKKTAISSILGKQPSPNKSSKHDSSFESTSGDDLFKLPALPKNEEDVLSHSDSEDDEDSDAPAVDLHSVDLTSDSFKSLPTREKYELLTELKETRKMNSWGKLHELPKSSDTFSDFQMNRLLKRRKVQTCLEETEKEMGGSYMTLSYLENLLNEEGIDTNIESLPKRIASNETTSYLLIKDMKQALKDAKERGEAKETIVNDPSVSDHLKDDEIKEIGQKDELEDDLQKAIQMSLECTNESEMNSSCHTDTSPETSFMYDSDESETDVNDTIDHSQLSKAKDYIMQNSDFTSKAIKQIITSKSKSTKVKSKSSRLSEILDELDKADLRDETNDILKEEAETSTLNLSSSEDDEDVIHISKSDETLIEKPNIENEKSETFCHIFEIPSQLTNALNRTEDDATITELHCEKLDEIVKVSDSESDLSDSEFEEVPIAEEVKFVRPVVQLTLNINDTLDDDIFADVFEKEQPNTIKGNEQESENDISQEITKDTKHGQILPSSSQSDHSPIEAVITDKPYSTQQVSTEKKQEEDITPCSEKLHLKSDDNKTIIASSSGSKSKTDKVVTDDIEEAKNDHKNEKPSLSTAELNSMADALQVEHEDLLQEKGKLDRMGRNITEQMTKEAQELLQLFGIPYVVAPMEAEAQCAFLESVKLTDGTITDDSDIWLFGGRTVYKNFFNQKKHVVQFLAERIERSFNLAREQLILLALLVGSDYTTGVNGVGPVTAMEILASFPCSKKDLTADPSNSQAKFTRLVVGLEEFKRWVRGGKRTDNTTLKKKLRNVIVTDEFPSVRVVKAYMEPNIEKSEEKFSWGEPNITVLRDYTKKKFGWSQNKFDEILNPVLKRMSDRKNQRSVQDYFKKKIEFHSLEDQMSKRVKAAVEKMGPDDKKMENLDMPPPKKRKVTKAKPKDKLDICDLVNIDSVLGVELMEEPSSSRGIPKPNQVVKRNAIVSRIVEDSESELEQSIDIKVPKLNRFQEIIPQREKDKASILQNKLKAIETFRLAKIDCKSTRKKRKVVKPKDDADLSESSDSS